MHLSRGARRGYAASQPAWPVAASVCGVLDLTATFWLKVRNGFCSRSADRCHLSLGRDGRRVGRRGANGALGMIDAIWTFATGLAGVALALLPASPGAQRPLLVAGLAA